MAVIEVSELKIREIRQLRCDPLTSPFGALLPVSLPSSQASPYPRGGRRQTVAGTAGDG